MSNRYKGAVISATPPTTTGGESGVASGAWTLEQQMQLKAAGLWPSQPPPPYIEAVFSTYLYTGNGSTQTITNDINLSAYGGMVWLKPRSESYSHKVYDTIRGGNSRIYTNTTDAAGTGYITSFNSNGFSKNYDLGENTLDQTYVAWTFRKQPKFFDVVTYTGNGTTQSIAHNLGSTPGFVMVKGTSLSSDWRCFHRSTPTGYFYLNATDALETTSAANNFGNNSTVVAPTSTTLTVGSGGALNGSGQTYVAYLFAHDAGGFGLTETENVISCGTGTWNGSGVSSVTLGYEPQWVMIKSATSAHGWWMVDNMRGMPATSDGQQLNAEGNYAESTSSLVARPTATGFTTGNGAASQTYIYIAIRRGPMAVPTDGTKVFTPATRTGDGTTSVNVTNATFPVDLAIGRGRSTSAPTPTWIDRLRGATRQLRSDNADAEAASTIMSSLASQTGWIGSTGGSGSWNTSSVNYIQWYFKRAPGFFDEVCYTGTGVARTVSHNLAAVPELMIVKCRSNVIDGWMVYVAALPATSKMILNRDYAELAGETTTWNSTRPTASVFSVGTEANVNNSGYTYVAYLFATCAGVSKVGSYTGTGTTQTINCGFTGGSRFVMIKRTDSTGDWYVWDSARGIIPSNDPYLLINTVDAETTGTDYVDTYSAGFEISSTAPAAINANGGTFIFLAIA